MNPSYQHYATHDESEYPELWEGCVGAWAPCLGPSGLTLHNHSGRANCGTLTNMDAASDWVVDGGHYALDFDGSNDYAVTTDGGISLSNFTVSIWIKWTAKAVFQMLFTKSVGGGGGSNQFEIRVNDTGSRPQLVGDGGTVAVTSVTNPTVGIWYFLLFTRSSIETRCYINGILESTGAAGTFTANTRPVYIGARDDSQTARMFSGRADDAQIRNRAFSPSEALSLYRLGRGGMYAPRRRRKAYFLGPTFNAAWARGANQFIQPSMIGVA